MTLPLSKSKKHIMSGDMVRKMLLNVSLPSESSLKEQPKKISKPHTEPTKKARLKEEPCLLNLLEKCISQVEIALTLRPDCASDIEDATLLRAIQKHQLLCEHLEKGEGRDGAELRSSVKNSYKNLLRVIRDNPDAAVYFKPGSDANVSKNEKLFVENLKSIFRCTLEKSLDEDPLLKKTPLPVPKNKEAALEEKITMYANEICDKDAEILSLKASISESVNRKSVSEAPLTDEECQSYINTPKHASLQKELDQLNIQRMKLFLDYREKERDIQEGTENVEDVIEYEIEQFDEKMEEMQADLEAREAELRRDEAELKRLETLFKALEVEYDQVVARRQEAEDRMREEQRILKLKTRAAIIAQAWWRGYRVRKALRNKAKKKKGKGKGKKK